MNVSRPAVRVVCVDGRRRVLLLRWEDPADGHFVWEPPGGGLEPGEVPLEAARRELHEETGLPGSSVLDGAVAVRRDMRWNGALYNGVEQFYLARFDVPPPLSRDLLEPFEEAWLRAHRWVPVDELDALADPLQPPELRAVLAQLDPAGGWAQGLESAHAAGHIAHP